MMQENPDPDSIFGNLKEYRGKEKRCGECEREFLFADVVTVIVKGPARLVGKIFCYRAEDYDENVQKAHENGSCLLQYVVEQNTEDSLEFKPRKFVGDVDNDYKI